MRIAVVQLAVEPTRRTLTFQRALRAIDAAAEQDPAPDLMDDDAWDAAAQTGAALILGTSCRPQGRGEASEGQDAFRRRTADRAGRCGLWCAVADVTTANADAALTCPGVSMIVDPGGQIVAVAKPGASATLWADLDLPQASHHKDVAE